LLLNHLFPVHKSEEVAKRNGNFQNCVKKSLLQHPAEDDPVSSLGLVLEDVQDELVLLLDVAGRAGAEDGRLAAEGGQGVGALQGVVARRPDLVPTTEVQVEEVAGLEDQTWKMAFEGQIIVFYPGRIILSQTFSRPILGHQMQPSL